LTQSDKNELEQTHPGADDPSPSRDRAGAGILIGPTDWDSSDLGVDLCIVNLGGEGAVGTTLPEIHPHCHLPSPEWLDAVANQGP
jgi:hypothetical protein